MTEVPLLHYFTCYQLSKGYWLFWLRLFSILIAIDFNCEGLPFWLSFYGTRGIIWSYFFVFLRGEFCFMTGFIFLFYFFIFIFWLRWLPYFFLWLWMIFLYRVGTEPLRVFVFKSAFSLTSWGFLFLFWSLQLLLESWNISFIGHSDDIFLLLFDPLVSLINQFGLPFLKKFKEVVNREEKT